MVGLRLHELSHPVDVSMHAINRLLGTSPSHDRITAVALAIHCSSSAMASSFILRISSLVTVPILQRRRTQSRSAAVDRRVPFRPHSFGPSVAGLRRIE